MYGENFPPAYTENLKLFYMYSISVFTDHKCYSAKNNKYNAPTYFSCLGLHFYILIILIICNVDLKKI